MNEQYGRDHATLGPGHVREGATRLRPPGPRVRPALWGAARRYRARSRPGGRPRSGRHARWLRDRPAPAARCAGVVRRPGPRGRPALLVPPGRGALGAGEHLAPPAVLPLHLRPLRSRGLLLRARSGPRPQRARRRGAGRATALRPHPDRGPGRRGVPQAGTPRSGLGGHRRRGAGGRAPRLRGDRGRAALPSEGQPRPGCRRLRRHRRRDPDGRPRRRRQPGLEGGQLRRLRFCGIYHG